MVEAQRRSSGGSLIIIRVSNFGSSGRDLQGEAGSGVCRNIAARINQAASYEPNTECVSFEFRNPARSAKASFAKKNKLAGAFSVARWA